MSDTFIGNYLAKVDEKNRIKLNSEIAKRIDDSEKIIYAFIRDNYIECYTKSTYCRLKKCGYFKMDESPLEVFIRKGKRITIEKFSELKSEDSYVKLVGCMNHFEVWNTNAYENEIERLCKEFKKNGLPLEL